MSDAYTCPHCGAVSYNPNDLRFGYCGRCKRWRDEFAEWGAFMGYKITDALHIAQLKGRIGAMLRGRL